MTNLESETAAGDAADPPQSPKKSDFASKATDLSALREAVVDAAGVGGGLWFSYLFSLFYLAIATAGITHRDLFLENAVRLPFLNVDLPLIEFFVVGPFILLLIHAYILLHFVLLASKIAVFHVELQSQIGEEIVRTNIRRQLPSNIFIQFMAGPHDVREGIVGSMLKTIAHISLVYGPVILLVSFQLCFLPYHHEKITLWHRFLIVADICLIWTLWPRILDAKMAGIRHSLFPLMRLAVFSLGVIFLVFTIATFPGEWLDSNVPEIRLGSYSPYKLLVAGDVDLTARKPKSLWSNRLVIPGLDVLDHGKFDNEEKIAALPVTISLRGRHLEGAVLIGANLRKADFTAAILTDANLSDADLRGANFGCDRFGEDANCTRLQGATLNSANLEGAFLDKVRLQGASLNYARFLGASLKTAKMAGVSAVQTQFPAALLDGVDFRGALLDGAGFQVASLRGADFRGAAFYSAQLQGADLNLANFNGALLERIFVWRVRSLPPPDQRAKGNSPEVGPKVFCADQPIDCNWSSAAYSQFAARLAQQFSRLDAPGVLLKVKVLDPSDGSQDAKSVGQAWDDFVRDDPSSEFEALRRDELKRVGCDPNNGPYVIRSFLRLTKIYFVGDRRKDLASALLDTTRCSNSSKLTPQEILELKSISDGRPVGATP
jgi:uncharacterized protein YjbI with pentapeptide repeats